jgi:hypothetical protein
MLLGRPDLRVAQCQIWEGRGNAHGAIVTWL